MFSHLTACSSSLTDKQVLADSSPTYISEQGIYSVGIVDNLTLKNAKSDRKLPIKVSYPQTQTGQFPVIIFSHGTGGSKDDYAELTSFWASQGYVCIQPTHADSIALKRQQGNHESLAETLSSVLQDAQGWQDRAAEISLIIDNLSTIERQAPQLQGKLDKKHIGVGGHSYGAYTAQLIGGVTIDIPQGAKGKSFADRRVNAVLLLSPQGSGQQGLTSNSWTQLKLPMMTMTGSQDRGAQGQGPDWKKEPFEFSPTGDKYLVFIEGANHFSFSGRLAQGGAGFEGRRPFRLREFGDRQDGRFGGRMARRAAQQQEVFSYVQTTSLAFWDAYLKDENQAKDYLKSDMIQTQSNGDVSIAVK